MVSSLPDNRTDDDGVLSDLYSALFKSDVCKYVTDELLLCSAMEDNIILAFNG